MRTFIALACLAATLWLNAPAYAAEPPKPTVEALTAEVAALKLQLADANLVIQAVVAQRNAAMDQAALAEVKAAKATK